MAFSISVNEMANKTRKCATYVLRTLRTLGNFAATIFFFLKMCDAHIKPMLFFGSEIGRWRSASQWRRSILLPSGKKKKKCFNVIPETPNDMVYGEIGLFPLYVLYSTSCIKYWLRLTTMGTVKLPRKADNMLLLVHNSDMFCLASQLPQVLEKKSICVCMGESSDTESTRCCQGIYAKTYWLPQAKLARARPSRS